jgi:hypothetical protein
MGKLKIFGCEISIFLNSTNFSVPRYIPLQTESVGLTNHRALK